MNDPPGSPQPPDWAFEHARALLRTGVRAPEIEQRFIAKGLSPGMAADVVERILEDRVGRQVGPQERAEWQRFAHRIASAVVGLGYLFLAYWYLGTWPACRLGFIILLPLACIWFADEMAAFTGELLLPGPSGGVLVRWAGWVLLLVIGVFWLGMRLAAPPV